MLKEYESIKMDRTTRTVLILILMEHAQRDLQKACLCATVRVLILILMEHAQRDCKMV